jgi:hypothetical protein
MKLIRCPYGAPKELFTSRFESDDESYDVIVNKGDFCKSRKVSLSLFSGPSLTVEPDDDLSVTILACRVTILACRMTLIHYPCSAPKEVFTSRSAPDDDLSVTILACRMKLIRYLRSFHFNNIATRD